MDSLALDFKVVVMQLVRGIFTELNPLTRMIFESLMTGPGYLDDDGTPVEPDWYAPIIPMILINGSKGIELALVLIFRHSILPK